ncbi:MAG: VWA domain-containing protein [Pirellulales bacterium]|nr:VWA domain-containing protein [Pirellulales bacterium]
MTIRHFARLAVAVVLAVALGNLPSAVFAQQGRAVMFDQLLEYVELQVPETKIEQLVATSPTRFILGSEQLDRLRAAGASEQLLQTLAARSPAVAAGSDVTDLVLILDCSGSMNDRLVDGGSKWQAARQAALQLIDSIPEGRHLSVIVYGTDLARKCHSVDLVRGLQPLTSGDKEELASYLGRLKAVGHTPIANSLELAGTQLENASGMSSIVLITDGMESCHGDPAAMAGKLVERFPHLRGGINVVGFCLGEAESRQVARIAEAGQGQFYDARNAEQLLTSMRKIETSVVQPAPPLEVNLAGLSALDRLLIEQLRDADIDVRTQAAKTLGERQVQAAVPALRNLLLQAPYGSGIFGDVDRDAALDAILAIDAEQAGAALTAALTSAERKVRLWAAEEVGDHRVVAAVDAVVRRLLAMNDQDLPTSAINGTDEADALFKALQNTSPERLEETVLQLLRGRSANVKAWASSKARQL